MPQQLQNQQKNLRLKNPTPYHLMATGQLPSAHPLSVSNNRDSPGSETTDLQEAFVINPFSNQDESEYPMYYRSESYGTIVS
ncbi:hypothetical protein G6F56_013670 [Rhizopus delemar]|nr:hypothetical protein G6F56_013670 [Rhizopus delemar]